MDLKTAEIVAMAVAVIAEELGTDARKVKVISFKEVDDTHEVEK